MSCHFKCSSTRNNTAVLNGILDSSQTITNSIFDLSDGVLVRTLNENEERGEKACECVCDREGGEEGGRGREKERERDRETKKNDVRTCILS